MSRNEYFKNRWLVFSSMTLATLITAIVVGQTVVAPAAAADEPVITLDCGPAGILADGTPCVYPSPACPDEGELKDGTPCVFERSDQAPDLTEDASQEATPEPTAEATPEATREEQSAPTRQKAASEPSDEEPDVVAELGEEVGTSVDVKSKSNQAAVKRARRETAKRTHRRKSHKPARKVIGDSDRAFFTADAPDIVPEAAPQVPAYLIPLYQEAELLYQVPWQILAAINEIESAYGHNLGPSSAGAVGWMQFMPATWETYGLDADGDGEANPNSPRDAIMAAASYLQAAGAPYHMRRALFAYNHADWYVEAILLRASQIGPASPLVERLVTVGGRRLEQRILEDDRISIYDCGRRDIRKHRIDRRVLLVLDYLASLDLKPTVTSLWCGHSPFTKSGNVSEHWTGTAVDIAMLNGNAISAATQGPGTEAEEAVRALAALGGAMRPHQIISLMQVEGVDNTFAMGDHDDHIHVGFKPMASQKRRARRAARRWAELHLTAPEVEFSRFISRKLRL